MRFKKASRRRYRILSPPVLIAVTSAVTPEDDFREMEDYAATACSVQILPSHFGIGALDAMVTGGITSLISFMGYLGSRRRRRLSVVKAGYPAAIPRKEKKSIDEIREYLPRITLWQILPRSNGRPTAPRRGLLQATIIPQTLRCTRETKFLILRADPSDPEQKSPYNTHPGEILDPSPVQNPPVIEQFPFCEVETNWIRHPIRYRRLFFIWIAGPSSFVKPLGWNLWLPSLSDQPKLALSMRGIRLPPRNNSVRLLSITCHNANIKSPRFLRPLWRTY